MTSSGTELLPIARRTLQEVDDATSRLGRTAAGAGPSVSFGATPLVAATVLPQAIREFREQRPNLRVQMFDGDAAAIMQKVEVGSLDMGLGVFFKHLPGVRRTALFRSYLMAIRTDDGQAARRRRSIAWSALKGKRLIALQPAYPLQQLIDRHLARSGVAHEPAVVLNGLTTVLGMVEAGEGTAIVPSFALPACRNRPIVISRLTEPEVHLDFHQIRQAGRKLPAVAEEFTAFLQRYLAKWAGESDVL